MSKLRNPGKPGDYSDEKAKITPPKAGSKILIFALSFVIFCNCIGTGAKSQEACVIFSGRNSEMILHFDADKVKLTNMDEFLTYKPRCCWPINHLVRKE